MRTRTLSFTPSTTVFLVTLTFQHPPSPYQGTLHRLVCNLQLPEVPWTALRSLTLLTSLTLEPSVSA